MTSKKHQKHGSTRRKSPKELTIEKNELVKQIDSDEKELLRLQQNIDRKKKRVDQLDKKLTKAAKSKGIHITEHAQLQFFYRIMGYERGFIESLILTEDLMKAVKTLGGKGKYPVSFDVTNIHGETKQVQLLLVMDNYRVPTLYEK